VTPPLVTLLGTLIGRHSDSGSGQSFTSNGEAAPAPPQAAGGNQASSVPGPAPPVAPAQTQPATPSSQPSTTSQPASQAATQSAQPQAGQTPLQGQTAPQTPQQQPAGPVQRGRLMHITKPPGLDPAIILQERENR